MWNLFSKRPTLPDVHTVKDPISGASYQVPCEFCKVRNLPCRFQENDEVIFFSILDNEYDGDDFQWMYRDYHNHLERRIFFVKKIEPYLPKRSTCAGCNKPIQQSGWTVTIQLKGYPHNEIKWNVHSKEISNKDVFGKEKRGLILTTEMTPEENELVRMDSEYKLELKVFQKPKSTQYSIFWRTNHPRYKEWRELAQKFYDRNIPYIFDTMEEVDEVIEKMKKISFIRDLEFFHVEEQQSPCNGKLILHFKAE